MSDVVLSCQGVSKRFEQRVVPSVMLQDHLLQWKRRSLCTIHAVRNVSLELRRGEWIGLYGPNGSGKTTLLRLIARLLPLDSGRIERRGTMSSFFQLCTGFQHELCGIENAYLHGLLHGLPRSEAKRKAKDVIAFAGLSAHRDLPIKCYSTGMLLRLGFAAATSIEADIYVLDEIFAVGDAAFQLQCWQWLCTAKARGKSAILVSHEMEHLQSICDRILFFNHGKIVDERLQKIVPVVSVS